jgi:hypothetical protein
MKNKRDWGKGWAKKSPVGGRPPPLHKPVLYIVTMKLRSGEPNEKDSRPQVVADFVDDNLFPSNLREVFFYSGGKLFDVEKSVWWQV